MNRYTAATQPTKWGWESQGVEEHALELADNPTFFIEETFGRTYWEDPARVLRALAKPRAKITWQGCHSIGKSQVAADATIWFTSSGGITLTTAPTLRQVKTVVWNKIRSSHKHSRLPLGEDPLRAEWQLSPDVFALGVTADNATSFQGFHGRRVLVLVDEAMGIPADMWGALHGIEAGGDVRFLELANPTEAAGAFYEHAHSSLYLNVRTSAFDTPNLVSLRETPDEPWESVADRIEGMSRGDPRLHDNAVDYLPSRIWVWERLAEWGRDHPMFESRVCGHFPSQSEWALVSLSWLDGAAKRKVEAPASATWQCGIDVGAGGEGKTVANLRHGAQLVCRPFVTSSAEPQGEVVRWLRSREIEHLGKRGDARSRIFVTYDSIGVGQYFANPLREAGFRCVGINVGLPARDKEQFKNLKAELYWALRERFREGDIGGVVDKLTRSQLATLQYRPNARGQIEIESKKELLTRGEPSPDHAESLMLTYVDPRRVGARRPIIVSV